MVNILMDTGNLHDSGGIISGSKFAEFHARGIVTELSKYQGGPLLGADERPLGGWNPVGTTSMMLRCFNSALDCLVDCPATVLVVATDDVAALPHVLLGWKWFWANGFSMSLGSIPKATLASPVAHSRPSLLGLWNETMRSGLSAQPVVPCPVLLPTDPSELAVFEADFRSILADPHANLALSQATPFEPDDCLQIEQLHELESEFVQDPPVPPSVRDDFLAKAVRFLPMELQNVVIARIRFSPFVGDRALAIPAVGGAVIRRDFSAPLPPGYKKPAEACAVDQPELRAMIGAGEGVTWERFVPSPGHVPPIYGRNFLVRSPAKPPRLVLDCVRGNSIAQQLPTGGDDIASILRWVLSNGDFFSTCDLAKAFHQIAFFDPDLIYCFKFEGVCYRCTRLPMGTAASMWFLDQHVQVWFRSVLGSSVQKYVDNLGWPAPSPARSVAVFMDVFDCCESYGVVIGFKDLLLGAPSIALIGHEVGLFPDGQRGYRKCPRVALAPSQAFVPKNMKDLLHFWHAARYAGTSTPRLLPLLQPLTDVLAGFPTDSKSLHKMPIPPSVDMVAILACIDLVVEAIQGQYTVSLPRADWYTIIVSDAEDRSWASLVLQCAPEELSHPLWERQLTVIAVHHGVFSKDDFERHIWEKELFALAHTLWLSADILRGSRGRIHAFTDSSTAMARSRPFAHTPASEPRILRWVMVIRNMLLEVSHLRGIYNVMADVLSRMSDEEIARVVFPVVPLPSAKLPVAGAIVGAVVTRKGKRKGEAVAIAAGPPVDRLLHAQNELELSLRANLPDPVFQRKFHRNAYPAAFVPAEFLARLAAVSSEEARPRDLDIWMPVDGLWSRLVEGLLVRVIPDGNPGLCMELLWLNHWEGDFHHSVSVTISILRLRWDWSSLLHDTELFCKNCGVCTRASDHKRHVAFGLARTPLGQFSLLTMDFCDMQCEAYNGHRFLLVLCDIYSLRLFLFSALSEDSLTAAQCCVKVGAFNLDFATVVSDQGSHFTSGFMAEILRLKGTNQFFSLAHVPFSRGVIEQAVRKAQNMIRKFMLSQGRQLNQWVDYLDAITAVANNTPSSTLSGMAPNEIMFGAASLPGVVAFHPLSSSHSVVDVTTEALAAVEEGRAGFFAKRREMENLRFGSTPRVSSRDLQNSFSPGDFVLVAAVSPDSKLVPRWSRTGLVTSVTGHRTVVVKDIVSAICSEEHVSNLRLYSKPKFYELLSEWELIFWSLFAAHGISHFAALRLGTNGLECQVVPSDNRRATSWAPVADWCGQFSIYFRALLESDLAADSAVHAALASLLR